MEPLMHKENPREARFRFIPHLGTWNANPIAAVAGAATLQEVAFAGPTAVANARAKELRDGVNAVLLKHGVPGIAYGRSSIWKLHLGSVPRITQGDFSNCQEDAQILMTGSRVLGDMFRKAMLLEGVDLMRTDGFTSSAHSKEDVARTVDAVDRALTRLKTEGALMQFLSGT
jgi:glutamate-1-semialdehyde 2,1-aminomutase